MSDTEDKIKALDMFKGKYNPYQPLIGSVFVRISDVKELIAQQVKEARIDEISHVWYDEEYGLILKSSNGTSHTIQDRLTQLKKELTE
jgi:hypothetical protein